MSFVSPVCLPWNLNESGSRRAVVIKQGDKMTVTGWGRITNNQTATELNYAQYNAATNTLSIDSAELESNYKQSIRTYFSAGGDLSYDAATGIFSFDVEQVYTKTNFDGL